MFDVQIQMRQGVATVATAGTRVQLKTAKTFGRKLYIKAPASNAGVVYIGDVTVAAANGFVLAAGEYLPLADLLGAEANQWAVHDLSAIYVDAATNGDKVTFVYFDLVQ